MVKDYLLWQFQLGCKCPTLAVTQALQKSKREINRILYEAAYYEIQGGPASLVLSRYWGSKAL